MVKLEWEKIDSPHGHYMYRSKVFGGWLVVISLDVRSPVNTGYSTPDYTTGYEWRESITFVPDTKHEWV